MLKLKKYGIRAGACARVIYVHVTNCQFTAHNAQIGTM
nr:MAG TPA: hypothetical protein [Caudoviricetes sp.]